MEKVATGNLCYSKCRLRMFIMYHKLPHWIVVFVTRSIHRMVLTYSRSPKRYHRTICDCRLTQEVNGTTWTMRVIITNVWNMQAIERVFNAIWQASWINWVTTFIQYLDIRRSIATWLYEFQLQWNSKVSLKRWTTHTWMCSFSTFFGILISLGANTLFRCLKSVRRNLEFGFLFLVNWDFANCERFSCESLEGRTKRNGNYSFIVCSMSDPRAGSLIIGRSIQFYNFEILCLSGCTTSDSHGG